MMVPLSTIKNEAAQVATPITNWSGNITFSTTNIAYPTTVAAVQQLVRQHAKIKVLGSRHCFNNIADSEHQLLSLAKMNKVLNIDTGNHTVTVEGGITYGELCPLLYQKGYALHNLASLPHISVAGSIATGTHGSGVGNGNLATTVLSLEMVMANGDLLNVSRSQNETLYFASTIGLGAFGVVTAITLQLQPAYKIQQYVFEQLPLANLYQNFYEVVSAAYSISLFTDWQSDCISSVWIKRRENDITSFNDVLVWFGATAAIQNVHPIANTPAENCTDQLGTPGPWHERLPHFKWGFTPSSGVELQSEYFVPSQFATDALKAVAQLAPQIAPHLFISEIRTIAADDFWLSPCYRQHSVALHFTWQQHIPQVMQLLPLIEKALEPFAPRPHWGKLFTMPAATLQSRYPLMEDFKQLLLQHDPTGKFVNEYLATHVLA